MTLSSLQTIKRRPKRLQAERLCLLSAIILSALSGPSQALVTSCAAGNYLMLDTSALNLRQGVCVTCPRGFICPAESLTILSPKKCNRGYYSDFGSAGPCTACTAGWYCDQPDTLPVPCPKGTYSSAGAFECTACPIGATCANGIYTACTLGNICNSNSPEPVPCPPGKRCLAGDSVGEDCPTGTTSIEGQEKCTLCPMGYYCPNPDHPAIECPDGYYADKLGMTACTICPLNSQCSNKAISPTACDVGTYSLLTGSMKCTDCPAGTSCSGTAFPVACPVGYYSLAKWKDCLACPEGFSCIDQKSTPVMCTAGYYSRNGEQYCNTCPAGFYCPVISSTIGSAEPIACAAGFYSGPKELSGAVSGCKECPAGSMCKNPWEAPKICEKGYSSSAGASFCTPCPAGAKCVNGVATFCADNEIPNADASACVQCPAGVACPAKDWKKQEPCKPGYYSTLGMMHCQVSPPGQYAPTTLLAPLDCSSYNSPYYYFADIGMTYCTPCPPGHQCKDSSGRMNVICAPGYYADGKGACTKCKAGKQCPLAIGGYLNNEIACPAGTYSPAGSFDCELCKPGKDCSVPAATVGETTGSFCLAGNYQLGGSATCSTCPANHECPFQETIVACPIFHYSLAGSTVGCIPCPDGSDCKDFSIQNTAPVTCAAGFYSLAHDFVCKACPKGHSCAAAASVPTKCAGGTYANEGQSSCTTCPDEYYSLPGSEYCSPVPAGYRINAANDNIEVCPHKYYSRWGEKTCTICKDGYLCPEMSAEGSAWQNSCPKGSWCAAGVQTKCPAGKYGIMERATSEATGCADCPPGYNCQPGTENFELVPCPKGGYCPQGQPVIACPAGTFNDQLYARSISDCKTCPIGHQCGTESTDTGGVCAEGYYCPRGSGDGSYPCPAGTHGNWQTGKRDVNECIPCPPGHYCPEGSGYPTPAPKGYYTPLAGMPSLESLYLCPEKFYCPDTGMTSYKGKFCSAGYVCPAGSTSSTQVECPAGTFSDRTDLHDVKHCDICPKGYSCDTHATSTNGRITACPNHRYCPDGTKTSKIPLCPRGTYAPFTKAKSLYDCIECPAGQYCDGSETALLVATGPQICPKGHYCPPGTTHADHNPCKPGYYNDLEGSTSINDCLHCGFNKYCPDYGLTTFTYCPIGTYNSESTTATLCTPCPAGFACNQLGDGTFRYPIPCPKGFYSAKGSPGCTHCPVGTYCPNEATTEADLKNQQCPMGTLCKSTTSYTPYGGLFGAYDSGINVYPNKKSPLDGGYACPLNKYCPKGTKKALDISRGTMQELWARGSLLDAIQMPAGNYTELQADGSYKTLICPAGYYCPKGSFKPIPCPTGFFRPNTNGMDADSCGPCPAGTYCDKEGTVIPTDCPKGYFCPEGAATAQPCPRGTYNPTTKIYDSRGCTPCSAGFYCPYYGQEVVFAEHQCDKGYYCIAGSSRPEPTDLTTGSRCPAGGYCTKGCTTPVACDAGQYGPYVGAFDKNLHCIACKPGYYCLGTDATDATSKCKAGFFCSGGTITYNKQVDPADGVLKYINAGEATPGYYAPEGSFELIKCPEGTYSEGTQSTTCINCGAGFFCDGLGIQTSTRPKCAVGHYCPSYDFFITEAAAISATQPIEYRQIPCDEGTYNPVESASSVAQCLPCPEKKACETRGLSAVTADCAAGYFCKSGAKSRYPDGVGTTQSGPCPVGYYCPLATSEPIPCPAGTFSPQLKATDDKFCLPCPPGWLCTGTGLSAPSAKCAAGKYCTNGNDELGCAASGSGLFCPLGSQFELVCPMGFYQSNQSRGYCDECPAGSYCMVGTASQCPVGYFCP